MSTTTATTASPPRAKAKQSPSPLFQAAQRPPGPATGSLSADAAPGASESTSTPAAPPGRPVSALSTAPDSLSSPDPAKTEVKKPIKAEIRKFVTQAVTVTTKTAHRGLTFGNDIERDAGLWIATAEEAEAIADPAATLIFDHVPPALLQSAVIHGMRLIFAVADYFNAHLDTKFALRRASRQSANPQTRPQNDVTGEMSHA
jgi:hypothetical protein